MSGFGVDFSGSPTPPSGTVVVPVSPSILNNFVSFSNTTGGQQDSGFSKDSFILRAPRNASGFVNVIKATDDSTPLFLQCFNAQTEPLLSVLDALGFQMSGIDAFGNFITNTTGGASIATSPTQKLSFWGQSPIVQPSGATQAALAAYATGAFGLDSNAHMQALYDLVVAMRTALVNSGIMKGAA